MWLYIPSPPSRSAPASACLAKACEPHSSYTGASCAPFATWSGKPLQPRSLSALWKRESLIRRLSGLTCSPSTVQRGADAWICSLQDSRARTSASPASVPGWMASVAGCSSTSSTLPTLAVRAGLFWRTSAPSLLPPPPLWTKPKARSKSAPPPASWENWPTAGGTRNGSLFPRPTWATPDCNTSAYSNGLMGPNLRRQAANWPTPDTGHERSKGDLMWPSAAAQWPTPASRDYRTPNSQSLADRGQGTKGEQLPNFVEHRLSHPVLSTLDGRPLSPTGRTLPRRLNPAFACWLMGWPIWWTNPGITSCAKSAMASYRCRLQQRLLSCCGGRSEGKP